MSPKILITFVLSLLLINIFISSIARADETNGIPSDLAGVETIQKAGEQIANQGVEKTADDYLKQEWDKILRNNKYTGPIMVSLDKLSPITTPLLKYTVGEEPSFSWFFILTITIWIFLVTYFYRIFSMFSTFSKWISMILAVAIMIIGSATGRIPGKLANWIISLFGILTSWWMKLIAVVLVIAILILAAMFSKQFSIFFEKMRERRKKMKEELNRAKLEAGAKVAEDLVKAAKE